MNNEQIGGRRMKKLLLALAISLAAGAAIGQGLPVMDIDNLIQQIIGYGVQINQYAQQGLQYENQILQYEALLKHLEQNPIGAVLPNFNLLITNAEKIVANGQNLAQGVGDVGANINKAFHTQQASFGMSMNVMTQASQAALQAAMLNAGVHRDGLQKSGIDQTNAQLLTAKMAAATGDLSALQALGDLMAAQLAESQKLRELISAQYIANGTMQMQLSTVQSTDAQVQTGFQSTATPIPDLDTGSKTYSKWNLYTPK